jgi:hypothetical protein
MRMQSALRVDGQLRLNSTEAVTLSKAHPLGLLCVLLVCGCQSDGNRRADFGVFTVAVAGDVVLVGKSRTYGTSGTFELTSLAENPIECRGKFRYNALPSGRATFTCSNGETGSIRLTAEGVYVGHGVGKSSFGPVKVLFGYNLWDVNRRLMPAGRKLVVADDGFSVVEVEAGR